MLRKMINFSEGSTSRRRENECGMLQKKAQFEILFLSLDLMQNLHDLL